MSSTNLDARAMEGSSSAVNPSFPMKIDFSPLKSFFDHINQKLNDSVCHPVNGDTTAQVQRLMAKQETVYEKCNMILRRFFRASIVENPEIAANNWQEVAALNLLWRWFTSEEEKIEKNLAETIGDLASEELVSDIDIGRLLISEKAKDARIAQDVETIFQDSFDASPDENLEVTTRTTEEVATLNMLLGSFLAIEESIENQIEQITRNSILGKLRISDMGHLIVSQKPVLDPDSIQVSLSEDAENLGTAGSSVVGGSIADETRSWDQDVETRLLTLMTRVPSSSGSDGNNDGRASTVEVVSNMTEVMEELMGQEREEQEVAPQPENSTDNANAGSINAGDYSKKKSNADVDDSGCGLGIHCNMLELEEKFKTKLKVATASSESHPRGGSQDKMLRWMNEGHLSKEDYEPMRQIMRRADSLEDQLAPAMVDLFLLMKSNEYEVMKTLQFLIGLEMLSGEDETSVVKKVAELLLMAYGEQFKVRQRDAAEEDVESTEKESVLVDEMLNKFTTVALHLEALRKNSGLLDSRALMAKEISTLDRILKEAERDFEEIVVKLKEVQTRLKYGKFACVIIAIANAVSHYIKL